MFFFGHAMKYKYVAVQLPSGGSWYLYGDASRGHESRMKPEQMTVLVDLLAEGWVPVREIAVGTRKVGLFRENEQLCLVLLSKED